MRHKNTESSSGVSSDLSDSDNDDHHHHHNEAAKDKSKTLEESGIFVNVFGKSIVDIGTSFVKGEGGRLALCRVEGGTRFVQVFILHSQGLLGNLAYLNPFWCLEYQLTANLRVNLQGTPRRTY